MGHKFYKNPANGYEERIADTWLLCLLFGPLYFAAKGIWTHALVSLVLALVTFGISWLIYPFLARGIIEKNYLRKGWIPVEQPTAQKGSKRVFLYLFLILILLGTFIIGMAGHMGSQPPRPVVTDAATSAPTTVQAPAKKQTIETWEYTTQKDTMTQKEVWGAMVKSSNTISLDFPYSGPQNAMVTLRQHPERGNSVIFQIERGQLLCDSYDGCSVLVRFDNQPAEKFRALTAEDHSTTVLFIQNYERFVRKLAKAHKLFIQVVLYQNGKQTFEFNVFGLKLNKTAQAAPKDYGEQE